VRHYELRVETAGRVVTSHYFDVTSLAYAPDGSAVISGSHDQTVKRVALATGKVEWHASGYYEQVNSLALSTDASLLVTGSSDYRCALRVLKAGAGIGLGAVRLWTRGQTVCFAGWATAEQIMAVALSPTGAGRRRREARRLRRRPRLGRHDRDAGLVEGGPLGRGAGRCVRARRGGARHRLRRRSDQAPRPADGAAVRTLDGHEGGATRSPSPRRRDAGVRRRSGRARLGHANGPAAADVQSRESQAGTVTTDRLITSVAFRPDGGRSGMHRQRGNTYGEPVRLWDIRTGELKRSPASGGRPIALSPDGTILAAGGKSVQLSDVRTENGCTGSPGISRRSRPSPSRRTGGSFRRRQLRDDECVGGCDRATPGHAVCVRESEGQGRGRLAGLHPEGYYDGSPGVDRFLSWRVGDELKTAESSPGSFTVRIGSSRP
jgi:WD40 repeat protein